MNSFNLVFANDKIFQLAGSRLVAYSLLASSWAVVDAIRNVVFVRLVVEEERLDPFPRLLQQIRFEGEDTFEDFFRPVLFVRVDGCEAFAGIVEDDCVAEEDLILRRDVVEDCGDCGQANVQRVQRMLDDRPKVQLQQEREALVASCQITLPESNHVEDRLANRVEHDVRLRVLVPAEVARLHVSVRPVAELLQIFLHHVEREELRPRQEAGEVADGCLPDGRRLIAVNDFAPKVVEELNEVSFLKEKFQPEIFAESS